jgi:hypothetical protein
MAIRFLTGLDSNFNEKMGGIAGRAGQGMMTGVGGSIAGLGKAIGNERLAGVDFRPEGVKLKEQLTGLLQSDTPESRKQALQIMGQMGATPEMLIKTAEQFKARDEAKAAGVATQADRDRRFGIQEDTLKLRQDEAAAAQKLAEDTAEADNVLRQSYLDIAVADGNSKLAKLIASGMPLEKIQAEMFKGSDAVVKALTSDERESFDTLMESPVFKKLAAKIKEPSNYFTYFGTFSDELETVMYQRAKQLKQAGGMSDAQALKRALEETAANFPNKGGGGSGDGGTRRSSRDKTGGNVPEAVEGSNDMFSGTKGTKGA